MSEPNSFACLDHEIVKLLFCGVTSIEIRPSCSLGYMLIGRKTMWDLEFTLEKQQSKKLRIDTSSEMNITTTSLGVVI